MRLTVLRALPCILGEIRNLGEFICLAITKAKATQNVHIMNVLMSVRLVTKIRPSAKTLLTASYMSSFPSEGQSDTGVAWN